MSSSTLRSFLGGELSPNLYARTDVTKYASGARTIRNFLVRKTGGLENRPGTTLVGQTAGPPIRLLPFVFNDSQTYVLEFTDSRMRAMRGGAYLNVFLTTPFLGTEVAALQITQQGDIVMVTHPNHPPQEVRRLSDTSWTIGPAVFAPELLPPTNLTLTDMNGGTTGFPSATNWVVTAVAASGSESDVSISVGLNALVINQTRTLTWNAVVGAASYNLYKSYGTGGYGFLTNTTALTYTDPPTGTTGQSADFLRQPTAPRNPFASVGDYPAACGFFQGRRIFAGSSNRPETVFTSRSGSVYDFSVSSPTQDDDGITFSLVGKKVARITHILDAATLLLFTPGSEWVVSGDGSGVLRPSDVNALPFSSHGCSETLTPIQIDRRVLYVQSRDSLIRDIAKDPWYGYKGNDLTIFSHHLFEGHTLTDWAFQEVPHSLLWCVRDDGTLLCLTDVAEQEVLAWHRHDTLGTVLACCVIPEGTEDRLYLAVQRGNSVCVERLASRRIGDIQDAIFTDSTLSYDGRNTSVTTMTISGGVTWEFDELLTVTASSASFVTGDVGNAVRVTAPDGTVRNVTIGTVLGPTVITGFPDATIPASLRNIPTRAWARAVDIFSGLSHLEGMAVAVVADGFVVASPNNPQVVLKAVVHGGAITLDQPYAYVHVGLPYVSDVETLDIDTPSGPSLKPSQQMLINEIAMVVVASRGIFAGAGVPLSDSDPTPLTEFKLRTDEPYAAPIRLITDTLKHNVVNKWSRHGRVFIRQVDPVPLSILAIVPTGTIPSPGQ